MIWIFTSVSFSQNTFTSKQTYNDAVLCPGHDKNKTQWDELSYGHLTSYYIEIPSAQVLNCLLQPEQKS